MIIHFFLLEALMGKNILQYFGKAWDWINWLFLIKFKQVLIDLGSSWNLQQSVPAINWLLVFMLLAQIPSKSNFYVFLICRIKLGVYKQIEIHWQYLYISTS